jgi:hypothetical protein
MNPVAAWRSSNRGASFILGVALLALFGPSIGSVIDTRIAGWAPDHGHIGDPFAVAHHTHPYDHHATHSDDHGSDGDVVYTPSDTAGIAVALAIAEPVAQLPQDRGPQVADFECCSSIPDEAAVLVPLPPPRA